MPDEAIIQLGMARQKLVNWAVRRLQEGLRIDGRLRLARIRSSLCMRGYFAPHEHDAWYLDRNRGGGFRRAGGRGHHAIAGQIRSDVAIFRNHLKDKLRPQAQDHQTKFDLHHIFAWACQGAMRLLPDVVAVVILNLIRFAAVFIALAAMAAEALVAAAPMLRTASAAMVALAAEIHLSPIRRRRLDGRPVDMVNKRLRAMPCKPDWHIGYLIAAFPFGDH